MLLEEKTMKKNIKSSILESYLINFFLLLFGIVLISNSKNFIEVAIHIFAYVAVVVGVVDIIYYLKLPKEKKILNRKLRNGILYLAFSIVAFFEVSLLKEMITIILGSVLIFQSALRMELNVILWDLKKAFLKYISIISLINLISGIILIINPFQIEETMYISIILIVTQTLFAIQNLCLLLGVKKNEQEET